MKRNPPDGTFKLTSMTNFPQKKMATFFCGVLATCLKPNLLRLVSLKVPSGRRVFAAEFVNKEGLRIDENESEEEEEEANSKQG